jgi:hypothetical protein
MVLMRWWVLSRDEVSARAREHVERQGLTWTEPVSITRRPLGGWQVMTAANQRGGNIFIYISRKGRIKGGTAVTPR